MQKQAIHRNFNAVFRLVYHLVLVSKYRRHIFDARMLDRCKEILGALCASSGGALLECSGEVDHVHALIDMPPRVRPSDLSSRRLRKEFPSLRAAYRGKAVLWSPSYCLISAGCAPIEILRQYVENQTRPD